MNSQSNYYQPQGLYRSRSGVILGVCAGIEKWREIPAWLTRLAFILAFIFTGFFPAIIVYIVLGIILKPEPALPPRDVSEEEFYDSYAHSRELSLARLREMMIETQKRTERLEAIFTDKEQDWEERFRKSS